ncbi:hypothetical protein [Altericroceibacterium endophyticum]|uniref:ZIP family metal transporter n=1 Tax=Altericroceibacterium endophyticum TaxID=1808508 RepID=A0A6I4T7X0_9SPHN|nr:hypothetical protein [Altericroceibacterium endophyticum]MXO66201.1 hypothetical protein [Altericroceibacterium endophyticum]
MDIVIPLGFAALSGLATLAGGQLALTIVRRQSILLSLSAGAIFAVALVAVLPEAIHLGRGFWHVSGLLAIAALGYAAYPLLNRALEAGGNGIANHGGPFSFALHAGLGGFIAAVGFGQSAHAGLVMASAAIAHGIAHGINTVALAKAPGLSRPATARWLVINASAPMLGALLALVVRVDETILAAIMAVLAGVFLFISSHSLFPRTGSAGVRDHVAVAIAIVVVTAFALIAGH